MKNQPVGKIIIEPNANIWPHELHIAKALAKYGYRVYFVCAHNSVCSADAYINDTLFEFKSPEGATIKSVERNLVRAFNHQSKNIAITSFRMKKIQDNSIINFLVDKLKSQKRIKHLIFITRDGKVVDINNLTMYNKTR